MQGKRKIKMPKRTGVISLIIIGLLLIALALVCGIAVAGCKDRQKLTARTTAGINEEMLSELDDIELYLLTLEKGVTDNKEALNSIKETTQTSEFTKQIEGQKDILTGIFERLTGVSDRVDSARSDVTALASSLNQSAESTNDSMGIQFSGVKDMLERLGGANSSSYMDIKAMLDSISSSSNTGRTELMSKVDSQTSQLQSDMGSLRSLIESKLLGLDEKLENQTNSINNRFDTLNTEFQTSINMDNENLNSYLQAAFESMNGRIDQVFQYASSGKGLLASTLTGYPDAYRVITEPNASFATIRNNVDTAIQLAINYGQSLTENNDSVILVPQGASVSIAAHFCSSDASNEHSITFDSWSEYQQYYNEHSSVDNRYPGGCFSESQHQNKEPYQKQCGYWHEESLSDPDGDGISVVTFKCTGCGNRRVENKDTSHNGWGIGYHYVTEYVNVDSGYYDTVCGFNNGQITHIDIAYN